MATTVPPHSELMVSIITSALPEDRDFLFQPIKQHNLSLYAHLVDHELTGILAKNDSDRPIQISRKFHLGSVEELDYEHCFQINMERELAKVPPMKTMKTVSAKVPSFRPEILTFTKMLNEIKLLNGVMVYGNEEAVKAFINLVEAFLKLFLDEGFVKVSEENWMRLSLKSDWESRVKGQAKVYPLGLKDREVIDRTFDELHRQGRLEWTKSSTPFSYPVFVVWKTLSSEERKGRAVIDIKGLNDLLLSDAYSVSLQSEIIARMQGRRFLSIADVISFFYQ